MQDMFKTSLKLLRNNMIFIQPLLLYLLISMTAFAYVANKNVLLVPKIFIMLSIILMTAALASGWFYINKSAVLEFNIEDEPQIAAEKALKNFKKFFFGVGENFFKILGAFILYGVISSVIMFVLFKFGLDIFGKPKIFFELQEFAKTQSAAEIMTYLNSVSDSDKASFIYWVWSVIITGSVINFFGVLYSAALMFEKKNIFTCLWYSVKFFFKNLLSCISIILVMFLLYFGLNLLSVVIGSNSLSFAILIILTTLYLNYYILLVFFFYNDRTKDNSNNRS